MKLLKVSTAFLLILLLFPTQVFALNIPDILTTTYQYDNASRLLSINHQPLAISYNYTYNDIGNRASFTEPLGMHNYNYDDIDQLIQATHPTLPEENFTYDALWNRNPLVNTHNATNRLLEDPDYTYTYDANGNRITKEDTDTGEVTTYHYNVENQLTQVDLPDGTTVNYYYDGLGRRIEKNAAGEITRYIYDGMDILAEYNGANELIRSYVHGPNIDEPLELNTGPNTYYYISDGLGSITALVDGSGNIVEQYRYDSFGNTTILNAAGEEIPESAIGNRYMFTAREYDAETGLYYYRLRYYDPLVGRFLQEDPVGYLLGPNLYTYVNNNPVNWIDPWGLWDIWVGGIDPGPTGETYGGGGKYKSIDWSRGKAWVKDTTNKVKEKIGVAWEKHKEFHQEIREFVSGGRNSQFVGYEYMTGYEVTSLGIGLTGIGIKGVVGGTLAGAASGGFWAIIGVETIWIGFDIFQGLQDRTEEFNDNKSN